MPASPSPPGLPWKAPFQIPARANPIYFQSLTRLGQPGLSRSGWIPILPPGGGGVEILELRIGGAFAKLNIAGPIPEILRVLSGNQYLMAFP